jgi:hypothetical protein
MLKPPEENGIIRKKEINVWSGELTPCLIDPRTQRILKTEIHRITDSNSIRILESEFAAGFEKYKDLYLGKNIEERFNWELQWMRKEPNSEFYVITLENDKAIQGAIEIRIHEYCAEARLIEVAPHNLGSKGHYEGAGGHLFAIAIKRSYETGGDGALFFDAKTGRKSYYQKTMQARDFSGDRMVIDVIASKKLYERYFGGLQ